MQKLQNAGMSGMDVIFISINHKHHVFLSITFQAAFA